MKASFSFILSISPCFLLLACKKNPPAPAKTPQQEYRELVTEVKEAGVAAVKGADIPILPVSVGDTWIYEVKVQMPEGVTSDGKAVEGAVFERKRTYIGKVKPSAQHPETGCFQMEAKGAPIEREYVDIDDERVTMRGSGVEGSAEIPPLWLEPGVLLVRAGLLGGESMPPIKINDPKSGAEVMRLIQIIGREPVKAAGREFETIRILMTGLDGKKSEQAVGGSELRRTIWFAPHYGIVKEEKSRFINDHLVLKESIELKSIQMKNDLSKQSKLPEK